jgi:N-acetylmuramoyl-L-alanine amidase
MTLWTDIAEWRGPVLHHKGTIDKYLYVVIHTADGSYEGTIAWQKNKASGNSSHFVVGLDGKIAQVNDTANRSGAQIDGNPYSIAIENAGSEKSPLTAAQVEANAKILAKAHLVHGIPLQITGQVGRPGLGHHSMGAESGANWGHSQCPGPIIKAQKSAILARAIQIVTGGSFAPEGDVMFLRTPNGSIYLAGGGKTVSVSGSEWAGVSPQSFVSVPQSLADKLLTPPIDIQALAAAIVAGLPDVDESAVIAALQSPEAQAALVQAANIAEDS